MGRIDLVTDAAGNSAIDAIRTSYDRVAGAYADAIADELKNKPFDRELLTRFAQATAGRGTVVEIGCGPGHVARFVHDLGVNVSGIDLSPEMVEQARRLNPEIAFRVGDMTGLELEDGMVAAIAAFYAIVNLTDELRQRAFHEMARVLAPGGVLLLSFHVGSEMRAEKELWGRPIEMNFYLLDPEMIREELERVGFVVEETILRGPYAPEVEYQSRRAYIWARKG